MSHDAIVALSQATFDAAIRDGERPALIDFSATTCGPCRAIAPAVAALAERHRGRLTVGEVDVDEQPALAERYGVRAVPTLLLFRRGEVVAQFVGSGAWRRVEEAVRAALEAR